MSVIKFDPKIITEAWFDVDGTLYNKSLEDPKSGLSIQDSHDFFKYMAFWALSQFDSLDISVGRDKNIPLLEHIANTSIVLYKDAIKDGNLLEHIKDIKPLIIAEYNRLLEKNKSNGKIFANELGTQSTYLHEMLENIAFESILSHNQDLVDSVERLVNAGKQLGILTTETYRTAQEVVHALGLDLGDFSRSTGTNYEILCAENVSEKKPSPEGFRKIHSVSTAFDQPRSLCYIGDHLGKDIEASLKYGVQAIHVLNDGSAPKLATMEIDGDTYEYMQIGDISQVADVILDYQGC